MYRPPPRSSPTSLPATFVSFLAHAGVLVGGFVMIPMEQPESVSSQMMYIPLELVTIDETTNMTAVVAAPEESEDEPEPAPAAEAAPAPAPPPVEEDAVSFEEPPPPKETPKKPEAKPAPPSKSLNESLDSLMDDAFKDAKPAPQRNNAAPAPGAATNEAPRLSVGDRRRMTASIEDAIKSQLVSKGCFADHSDMADAKRLRATFRVWFGRNGKFSQKYQLVAPAREPFNDPPMQAFIAHARRALDMCNNLGWQVPEEYFRLPQPQYIDLTFLPKIGAAQ